MMDINKKLYLYANCLPVKGATNAIICDLHRGAIYEIDAVFYDILTKHSDKTVKEIVHFYGEEYFDEIIAYLEQLIRLELIFLVDSKEGFIDMPLNFDTPSLIENMIIEYGDYFDQYGKLLVRQLNQLRVTHVEIRFYEETSDEKILQCLELFQETGIKGINLLLQGKSYAFLQKLTYLHARIAHICVFNAEEQLMNQANQEERISFLPNNITDNTCCGVVRPGAFFPNIHNFTESLHFNSCLNRKMSVDKNGEIKNCPSLKLSFGNISQVNLVDVAHQKKFQKLWSITKDQINVCKDCEYRYVCVDCRAYTEDPEDIFSKPLKCGYNPYSGEWAEWSTNPLKQKAMKFYGFETTENTTIQEQ
jgi:SPASM domain peptide maturase of grasp-with-spasm system